MDTQNRPNGNKSSLERHVQTVLLSLITAGLITAWGKVGIISDSLIRIEERSKANEARIDLLKISIEQMSKDIGDLKERMIRTELTEKEPKRR